MANSMPLATCHDLVDHLLDAVGGPADARGARFARSSVMTAYDKFPLEHDWGYYKREWMVVPAEAYSTGTITYTHSTRTVTLTGGTFPDYAARGRIRINEVDYEIDSRESDTELILSIHSTPGADVASTKYTIFRELYSLPIDFQAGEKLYEGRHSVFLDYLDVNDYDKYRRDNDAISEPRFYTIVSDPDFQGGMAVAFWPPSNTRSYTYRMRYRSRALPIKVVDYTTGTITASSGSATITGSGTSWTDDMVGSCIRLTTGSDHPTSREGDHPYTEERVIVSVDSPTTATLDAVLGNNYAGKKYRISSIIDVEPGTMFQAFRSLSLLEMDRLSNAQTVPQKEQQYIADLYRAKSASYRGPTIRQNRHIDYSDPILRAKVVFD